ncbi:4,5-DOPA dioxygenase extradiol [Sulfurospirillum arcachonense]|uniref:4,5-DOPA-extradiol-dioxygenase n=1 Tax=Sulfurospirillum arcachonense TaxID=57666 RepID=UPI000468CFEA|nr:4,5-DOPA dioxygenase extradiol [Sulfurospirillum arcachonense]
MKINRRKFTYLAGLATILTALPSWATNTKEKNRAPALFIGHGTPMNAFTTNEFTKEWDILAKNIHKPKAILVVSAHWETIFPTVSTSIQPPMIYDFYGFPDYMYEKKYPAPGAPIIAQNLSHNLNDKILMDNNQGLDHGAWSVLSRLFPKADVPVFQFSLARSLTPMDHYLLAQEIRHLRDEGVMIIGSGNITHNIPSARQDSQLGTRNIVHEWAQNFDDSVVSKINSGDFKALANYEKMGKDAKMSVPTPEHFLPLLYVLGSVKEEEKANYYAQGFQSGSFSMRSVLFS